MSSSDIAIKVENIGKRYRIGLKEEINDSFVAALFNFVKSPLKNYKKHRSIYKFNDDGRNGGIDSSDTIWAVRDVSFEVKKGEVLGIIGRNGAGKSTLLKILSMITDPTVGKAEIHGRISSLLEVGTGFHPELTGRENIFLNGTILGMRKQEVKRKFDDIVEFSGIEKFLDTPVKRYSSGMRVRLAFAVASHLEPEILLVDEVLAVGDAEFQKKCLNKMENVGQKGRTVIFVSHHMAAIENLCSRVMWIDNGQIKQDGQAYKVIESYMSSFVQTKKNDYNLRDIETRDGSGEIRYTEIEFLTADGKPQEILRSGDSVNAKIHYYAKEIIKKPHFSLEVFTETGALITSTGTWSQGIQIPVIQPGEGHIDLEIDFLNFMPARYYISLKLGTLNNIYDFLDRSVVLDIETSDYFNSGKGIDRRLGIIFLPCRWKHYDSFN